jgi:hypothetical protein
VSAETAEEVEEGWVNEPGDQLIYKLPFTVKDEDGVEWCVRLTAFEGEVTVEQYRFEPGRRVARDVAKMDPAEAVAMAIGLERMAVKAAEQIVREVHED